jgi:DNA-directed RNA polymerase specialized sigma24 family protein
VAVRLNISLSAVKSRASRLRHKIGILAQDLLADEQVVALKKAKI